jgi:signal transduction histidine kinase
MIRQRDDFVARLTHDLRTPLVAANRMLKLCQNDAFGPMPDDGKHAIATIVDSNRHLLSMVNTLLEVYRHEAGHKALTLSPVDLFSLAETVVVELAPIAAEKSLACLLCRSDQFDEAGAQASSAIAVGIALSDPESPTDPVAAGNLLVKPSAAFTVAGDHLELRRVLTNLVGNAIKFTDSGSVTVTVSTVSQLPPEVEVPWCWRSLPPLGGSSGSRHRHWHFPDEQGAVFEWFRQGNQARAGHGLGLHLSQRIARLHSGTIALTSEVGQGSCFTLYYPSHWRSRIQGLALYPRPPYFNPRARLPQV